MSRFTLRGAAVEIVRRLQAAGATAYLAGGCVRDRLLGVEPNDYDVATDADPARVRKLFRHSRYVGEAFGVVRVRLGGRDIEVATFRLEWGYEDGRRPDSIQYTDAEHDARRRDFTINGLFEDPLEDRIIDYVGGQADLRRGVVRAIGDPNERFEEDHLRLLRAVRFSARLGFEIEPSTREAIVAHAGRLSRISRERIGLELQTMLTAEQPKQRVAAVGLIQQLHLDGPTLGERSVDPPPVLVESLPAGTSYPTVLAGWMLDRHCPPTCPGATYPTMLARFAAERLDAHVRTWRKALCLSNEHRNELQRVIQLAARALDWPGLRVAGRKRLLADASWDQARRLLSAMRVSPAPARIIAAIDRESGPLLTEGVAPDPWVSGNDLIAMGMRPGPSFKRLLDEVYDAQLEGRVSSRDEALAWVSRR